MIILGYKILPSCFNHFNLECIVMFKFVLAPHDIFACREIKAQKKTIFTRFDYLNVAFYLPSLSHIIIGLLRKLPDSARLVKSLIKPEEEVKSTNFLASKPD